MSRYNAELFDEIDNASFIVTDTQIEQYSAGAPKLFVLREDWADFVAALDSLIVTPETDQERYVPRVNVADHNVTFTFDEASQSFTETAVGAVIHTFSVADWTELAAEIQAKLDAS